MKLTAAQKTSMIKAFMGDITQAYNEKYKNLSDRDKMYKIWYWIGMINMGRIAYGFSDEQAKKVKQFLIDTFFVYKKRWFSKELYPEFR